MKIQKFYEATTETTPVEEMNEIVVGYDLSRVLEKIIEKDPLKVIKITYNVTIEY